MESGRSRPKSEACFRALVFLLILPLSGQRDGQHSYTAPTVVADRRPQATRPRLFDGDLVFRRGRDLASRLVLSQGDAARFSHVGVIVTLESGVAVVHALPKEGSRPGGVRVERLSEFASPANAAEIAFYRPAAVTEEGRVRMRRYILAQVGKPFDDEFRLSDDRRFYCTGLAIKALASGGVAVAAGLPQVRVMLLAEPVVPPDYLRRSALLEPIHETDERVATQRPR